MRPTVILAAAAACVTSLVIPHANAVPLQPTITATPSAASPAASPVAPRQVTLVTGDVVTVSTQPDGRQTASVARANPSGPGGQFQTFNLGSDLYVVPQSAVPYLGSTMDLKLFDVSHPPASVHVTYRSGSGTFTAGRAFGAALAQQAMLDHASPTHTTGLFATIAHLSAVSAPVGQPSFAMHTLTVNGIDPTGAPDTGDDAFIVNIDDLRKYGGLAFFNEGLAKVSVPSGHYAAIAFFYDFTTGMVRAVTLAQFSVTADSAITVDARAATSPVSVTTPQPAPPQVNSVTIGRTDKLGSTASSAFLGGGTTSFLVQPVTRRVSVGQLHYYVYTRAVGDSVTYDVEFPSDGAIPVNQHYVADPASLARVDSSYPASHPDTTALDTRFGFLPWESFGFAADLTFTTPTQRAEYYTARPDLNWQGVYYSVFDDATFSLLGPYQSAWRTYAPGTSYATTWGGAAGHPRLLEAPIYIGETVCPACLSAGGRLDLLGYPFGDNSPEHFGFASGMDGESVSEGVYADDVPVQQGDFLDAEVTMPDAAQTYRIDYNTTRSSADFLLSTDVRTRWTVPATVRTGSLPSGWVCTYRANPPASCGVLPLITSDFSLPVNLLGQLPAGAVAGVLTLGHLVQSGLAFRSVQVKVSFNGGQTWSAATVSDQGSGQYGLGFSAPAGASYGALQVTARDAVGGTFTQTIQHAFAIGG
jgi:hypothetical protein